MKYEHITSAVFLERPNRFIAYADLNGKKVTCHVKNTGRCRELLLPGTTIILQFHPDAAASKRKTEYSLIGVYKKTEQGTRLINLDSQAPNQVAWEWLSRGHVPLAGSIVPSLTNLRREVCYRSSRFDLSFLQNGSPAFMEVKGVTLEENGIARFPDAPTERGVKHLQELEAAAKDGYLCYVLFVIAMKNISVFEPNMATHPQFGKALAHAASHGVTVLARDCIVTSDTLSLDDPVPVRLPGTDDFK